MLSYLNIDMTREIRKTFYLLCVEYKLHKRKIPYLTINYIYRASVCMCSRNEKTKRNAI